MFWNWFKKAEVKGQCKMCGKCCENLILVHRGRPLKNINQFTQLAKKKPFYKNFKFIYQDEKEGYLYFSCQKLKSDKQCGDYANRPGICRLYPKHILKYKGRLPAGCGFEILPKRSFASILKKEL